MQPQPTQANLRVFLIPFPFFIQLILSFNRYDCKGVMHRNPWSGLGSQNQTIPSTFFQPSLMHRNPWSGLGSQKHTIPSTFFQPLHLRHRQSNDAHKLVGIFYQSQLLFITRKCFNCFTPVGSLIASIACTLLL